MRPLWYYSDFGEYQASAVLRLEIVITRENLVITISCNEMLLQPLQTNISWLRRLGHFVRWRQRLGAGLAPRPARRHRLQRP
jgi:hypothetical protein